MVGHQHLPEIGKYLVIQFIQYNLQAGLPPTFKVRENLEKLSGQGKSGNFFLQNVRERFEFFFFNL